MIVSCNGAVKSLHCPSLYVHIGVKQYHSRLMMGVLLLLVLYYFVRRFKRKQRQLEHEMQIESQLLITKQEREQEKQIRLERERFFTTSSPRITYSANTDSIAFARIAIPCVKNRSKL